MLPPFAVRADHRALVRCSSPWTPSWPAAWESLYQPDLWGVSRWLPVAAISVILFVAALLALLFAFRKDRHDFENMLAAWLAKSGWK